MAGLLVRMLSVDTSMGTCVICHQGATEHLHHHGEAWIGISQPAMRLRARSSFSQLDTCVCGKLVHGDAGIPLVSLVGVETALAVSKTIQNSERIF